MYECGVLNPYSKKGNVKAEKLYEQIRKRKTDYTNVARNSGFSLEQCVIIKNYLFNDMHDLSDGYRRFDPDLAIAQSWQRLSEVSGSKILKHDIILLYHELTEIIYLLNNTNKYQAEAHNFAEQKYNYSSAVRDYYIQMGYIRG